MALHVVRNVPSWRRRRPSRAARLRRRPGEAFLAAYTAFRLLRLAGRLWRG